MEKEYLYLINLIKCVLNNKTVKYEEISYETLFMLACKHSVAAMVFDVIKEYLDEDLLKRWEEVKNKAIVKDIYQKNELTKLSQLFDKEGIRCMPLKGSLLKKYYPKSYYREMADLDICVDSNNRENVKDILVQQNYTVDHFGKTGHDVYFKKPIYNIEIHDYLIDSRFHKMDNFFKDGFSLANTHHKNVYYLSNEDYYLHLICHAYKHFYESGTGIRSIMDIYVFRKHFQDQLDEKYINDKLEYLEVLNFEKEIRELGSSWFEDKAFTIDLKEFEKNIIDSGTYGNKEVYVHNYYQRYLTKTKSPFIAKVLYYKQRLFPKTENMKDNYLILKKCSLLLPLCYIHRLLNALFNKQGIIKNELKILEDIKKSPNGMKSNKH